MIMKIEDIQDKIWINSQGQLVIDSRLKDLPETLISIIEDNIYIDSDQRKEFIDWSSVEEEWEKII